ncbi:MAG TPA: hypothetical protein VM073_12120 [Usitatibacter sp.]|nr:hypothetical protein [Usitatibacter sp.]
MNENPGVAMQETVAAEDLFVVLERAFRRRTRACDACVFTVPYRVWSSDPRAPNWAIVPSADCSETCRSILEELVVQHQQAYRLSPDLGGPVRSARALGSRPH